ncbi:hypothetical protein [Hansschlegelia plantiphila]|uniref:Uncharacterized protein n=1 Tax=Hansschlegelia plantiphila TaxID=374655 RepID=A0A9W6IYD7_9HYPH|nr:hypothetical protein [Hansschlegelia plantiphila]GLK67322.1 hypothetical protein GCM10008179_09600 [Hansschlegelia plantiphila]
MLVAALLAWATGALDRIGLEGAGEGLGIGAAVCAPLWLLSLYRRSRGGRRNGEP